MKKSKRGERKVLLAKVLLFDDNLGRGIVELLETKEKVRISHKEIEGEGFKVLDEGEIVELIFENDKKKVRRKVG